MKRIRTGKRVGIVDWDQLAVYLSYDIKISSSTVSSMKRRHKILFTYFQDIPFNRQTFNTFLSTCKQKGNTNGYLNKFISLAKHIDKYMGINQLQDYTYYKEKKNIYLQLLTPKEIEQLAEVEIPYSKKRAEINYHMKCLIYFLARTGCRISEALSLCWNDVFDTFVLFRDTKNGDDRKVPIFNSMLKLLNGLPRTTKYVFNAIAQKVNEDLKRRAKACGIEKKVYCHLFRHSYIDQLNKQRVPLAYIQAIVGHKSLESTQRYLHPQLEEVLYFMHYHPLEQTQQTYADAARLLDEFIHVRIDKRFKVDYRVKEVARNSLI